jgi:predicted GTPase
MLDSYSLKNPNDFTSNEKANIFNKNKYTATLAKFGQTGAGKTSLSNALFGLSWRTDYAVACTQTVTQYEGKMLPEFGHGKDLDWRLCDTPGIGESEYADDKHFGANR